MYYFIATVQCISEAGGYCARITQVLSLPEKREVLTGLAQVPGLEFLGLGANASLGDILSALYVFGLGLVAVSALLVLTASGIMYITAGDNEERFKESKKWMGNAAFGLFLALISYLILFTINPDLTKVVDIETLLKPIGSNPVGPGDNPIGPGTIPEGGGCTFSSQCVHPMICASGKCQKAPF